MFFVQYDHNPLTYHIKREDVPKIAQCRKSGESYFKLACKKGYNRQKSSKLIAKGLRQFLLIDYYQFGFNYGKFLYKNFLTKKHSMYLKNHQYNLKNTDQHYPWLCTVSNASKILDSIRKQLETIQNLNMYKLSEPPFDKFVSVSSNVTKEQAVKVNDQKNIMTINDKKDPSIIVRPYYDNARSKLARLWHPYDKHYYCFTATYKGQTSSPNSINGEDAYLLQDIYHDGNLMTTHNWIFNHRDQDALRNGHAFVGDKISFVAYVYMYTKDVGKESQCDFCLKGFKNVHPINKSANPPDLNNYSTNDMANAVNALYDDDQLKYLLLTKRQENNKNLKVLDSRLRYLQSKVSSLQTEHTKLAKENQAMNKILGKPSKSKASLKISQKPQNNHHIAKPKPKKQFNDFYFCLLGSLSDMKSVCSYWNGNQLSKIAQRGGTKPSRVIGISRRLHTYMKRTKTYINAKTNIPLKTIINIASRCQKSALDALHEFHNNRNHKKIKQISEDHDMSYGSLLSLRKSKLANKIYKKVYSN